MKKLPNIEFKISISTQDDEYLADITLEHRVDKKKSYKTTFKGKNLNKLCNAQKDALHDLLVEMYGTTLDLWKRI